MRWNKWLLAGGMVIFVLLQLPFLQSDPDIRSSNYGGPYTDEGLNCIQLRNYLNHGDWTFQQSDNLVKTPLFAGYLWAPFTIFGTHLWVGRLSILLGCLLLLSLAFWRQKLSSPVFGLLLLGLVLGEFHVFHFMHYCLAEALCTLLIFASIAIANSPEKTGIQHSRLLLSTLLVSLSYLVKIQFLYVLPLLPGLFLLLSVWDKTQRKKYLKQALFSGLYLSAILAVYLWFWYLPHHEFFEFVMRDQTDGRFVAPGAIPRQVAGLVLHLFLTRELAVFFLAFLVLWGLGVFRFLHRKSGRSAFLFVGCTVWIVLESHKMLMTYHPTRYYVSLFFAMGVCMALVLSDFWVERKSIPPTIKYALAALTLVLLGLNGLHYAQSMHRRTFEIRNANRYLAQYPLKNELVLGARATSLVWECQSLSMPVWAGYFNDTDILARHPRVIIEDARENASNRAYSNDGIDLSALADSSRHFGDEKWNVEVYWISPEHWK